MTTRNLIRDPAPFLHIVLRVDTARSDNSLGALSSSGLRKGDGPAWLMRDWQCAQVPLLPQSDKAGGHCIERLTWMKIGGVQEYEGEFLRNFESDGEFNESDQS